MIHLHLHPYHLILRFLCRYHLLELTQYPLVCSLYYQRMFLPFDFQSYPLNLQMNRLQMNRLQMNHYQMTRLIHHCHRHPIINCPRLWIRCHPYLAYHRQMLISQMCLIHHHRIHGYFYCPSNYLQIF